MARPRKYVVQLTDEDITRIRTVFNRPDTPQTLKNRCWILLDLDENHQPVLTHAQCAARLDICKATVSNTVLNYSQNGLDSVLTLGRNPKSDNARRKIDGRAESKIIHLACSQPPAGHSRWTLRLLEQELKVILDEPVGREAIRRTLKKTNFSLTDPSTGSCLPEKTQNS